MRQNQKRGQKKRPEGWGVKLETEVVVSRKQLKKAAKSKRELTELVM